jgi:hypothetical protein
MIITEIKTIDGKFRVYCHRTGESRDAHDCKKCKRFIAIDPVKSELKCKRDI